MSKSEPKRVLLVDDEPSILATFRPILEGIGCDVQVAQSAKEALTKIAAEEFELIITDVRMETPSAGYEVVRAARSHGPKPAVAVLTAFPLTRSQCIQAGADAVFVKGAGQSIPEMLRTIEELLTRPAE